MVSGDRNNPLDYGYTSASVPENHRLTVVFDRQDGDVWKNAAGMANGVITDGALADFTANVATAAIGDPCGDAVFRQITPGCSDYYLAPATGDPKFGYYMNFPPKTARAAGFPPTSGWRGWFVPKGINPPTVVSGSLLYTIFKPAAADPCTGGAGTSESWVIADAVNPLRDDRRRGGDEGGMLMYSRLVYEWGGAASNYIQLGGGALQGGDREMRTVAASHGHPRIRVWRTIRQ
jgi:hypothetical protein